jgi:hypothetical protein
VRRPPATLGAVALDVVRAAGMILVATLLQVTIVPDLVLLGGRPDVVVLVVVHEALGLRLEDAERAAAAASELGELLRAE